MDSKSRFWLTHISANSSAGFISVWPAERSGTYGGQPGTLSQLSKSRPNKAHEKIKADDKKPFAQKSKKKIDYPLWFYNKEMLQMVFFHTLNFVDILLFQVWEILQVELQCILRQHTSELELFHISLEETQLLFYHMYIFSFIYSLGSVRFF